MFWNRKAKSEAVIVANCPACNERNVWNCTERTAAGFAYVDCKACQSIANVCLLVEEPDANLIEAAMSSPVTVQFRIADRKLDSGETVPRWRPAQVLTIHDKTQMILDLTVFYHPKQDQDLGDGRVPVLSHEYEIRPGGSIGCYRIATD